MSMGSLFNALCMTLATNFIDMLHICATGDEQSDEELGDVSGESILVKGESFSGLLLDDGATIVVFGR